MKIKLNVIVTYKSYTKPHKWICFHDFALWVLIYFICKGYFQNDIYMASCLHCMCDLTGRKSMNKEISVIKLSQCIGSELNWVPDENFSTV